MQVNSRYVPQLQEVLQWPQSAGIVGGRPSSSLYFIGHQGQSVLFLDPHEVQEVCYIMPHAFVVLLRAFLLVELSSIKVSRALHWALGSEYAFYRSRRERAALQVTKVCCCSLGDGGTNTKRAQRWNV